MKIEIDQKDKKFVCITGPSISDQNELNEKIQVSDAKEITFVELAEIIDVQAIQFLMDDFYKLVHMPIGLNDLKGKVLAGAGWQDICTKFHWVHPEACKHCIGSGTKLSEDVLQGETKLYKCKNNMWDITAPIMVGSLHVGYIFSGQFFFDDELLDDEHFRSQARKYGFDEEGYLIALERVPRLSREAVETGMSFFLKFANLLSELSYSKVKLTQLLSERDALVNSLRESEKRERTHSEELSVVLDTAPAAVLITHDSQALRMTGNRISCEWLQLPRNANLSKTAPEGERPETFKLYKNGAEIPLADMPMRLSASGKEVHDYEFEIVYSDGTMRHLLGDARPLRDDQGNPRGAVAAFVDITERKQAEQELEMAVEFLSLVNKSKETADLVRSAVGFLRKRSGMEAVGIRLKEGNDYPYFETNGFSAEFVKTENSLCARDESGQNICDSDGCPILECMCGNVICGRFDSSKPFFTARGSFWTNSTTDLLATTTDADRHAYTRNRCNGEGYESVALIALRMGKEGLGLLQLNDRCKGKFSPRTIAMWERMANYLAIALSKAHADEELRQAYENLEEQSVELEFMAEELKVRSDELQEAYEALRKSEEKYRSIVETANEGISINDIEGRVTYVNKRIEDMFGYCSEKVIGRSMWDFISEESKVIVRLALQNELQGINESLEIKYIRKDGSPLWALVNSKSLYETDGSFIGIMSMLTDITERKQAEKALRESETRFRALAENSPDIITRFDRQCRHVYANPAAVRSYDSSLDEIIGKTQGELGRAPRNVKFWEKHLENAFVKGKTETIEYHYISTQGKKFYFNTKIVPEFADGKVISVLAISRDITDIKETEAKLKETLDNLESLVEERTTELEIAFNSLKKSENSLAEAQKIAHIGSWEWDIPADKAYWSDEMYRIFGLNPQEGSPAYDELLNYVKSEDRDYVVNTFNIGPRRDPHFIDFRISLATGEERMVHMQSETIFEGDTPVLMKGTIQDITERTRSEEKIRNLAHIVESSSDAIGTISPDGIITSWNKGAELIYGYSAEEILGKPASIVAPPYLIDEIKNLSEKIKQGESIHHYETMQLRKDGKKIYVSITLSPVFDSLGKMTAISFISRDITENKAVEEKLRESEKKYRNIVETANEGILIIDKEAIIIFANNRLEDMLGYDRLECIGRPIWDYLSEEPKAIVKTNQKNRLLGMDDRYELKLIKKDGSIVWVSVNAKPLFDEDDNFLGSMSMLTDITRRKEAEQALANIEISREKEIHHRIKNNLQVVSSLLDLQAYKFKGRSDINDSEVIDAFRESQNRVVSMALIHEELYKRGGLEAINFSEYVEKLADHLLSTYQPGKVNISFIKNLEDNLFFDMDTAIPLGTIINELVSNSFKHAFPGRDKGEVRIILHREEGDFIKVREECKDEGSKRTNLILSVSDNGVGIPNNLDIENLDSLGLLLVTSLVEQIDGELEIKRNKGTEFIIKFTVTEKNNKASISDSKKFGESPKFHN